MKIGPWIRLYLKLILVAVPLLQTSQAIAEDWAHWRGPNGDGSSATAKPPIRWDTARNVKWKVAVPGKGSSTPIIWGDNVFVLTAIRTDRESEQASDSPASGGGFGTGPKPTHCYQFVLLNYDRNTGREKWRSIATEAVPHEAGHLTNTYASSSPVTDGKHVYVSFGSRGIYCFDFDGNRVWERQLGKMQTRRQFGEASSPALYGDTLVIQWDHEGPSFVTALDARSGKTKWKTDRDEPTTWSTPAIVRHRGRTQVITNGTVVRSYDLDDGSLIWQCGGQAANPIPVPIVRDGVVYCMTGYRGNAVYAISLDAKGDVEGTDAVRWYRHDAAPYVSSAVLYGDQLYFTKGRSSVLSSLDIHTGQPLIDQQRLEDMRTMYASPVAADGRVYFTSREGVTVVLRHGQNVEVLATNEVGETVDASPAIVDDQLFLRGEEHLYCIRSD